MGNIQPNGYIICYILSGPIFQYELNGDVIRQPYMVVSQKYAHIIHTFWIYFLIQIQW